MIAPKCPYELKSLYREGRVIPFVGAGASMSCTWDSAGKTISAPSWRALVDEAIRQLGFDDPAKHPDLLRVRGTDLQILEYYRVKNDNMDRLKVWLARQLDIPDDVLRNSILHTALAKLVKCRLYYTTNYDDFIERSLNLAGRDAVAVTSVTKMASERSCEVIKFHGDLNDMEQMVMSESDYERRLKLDGALDFRLKSDALNRALLFIGYSFRDVNVSYLFRLINETFLPLSHTRHGTRGFIVVADPSDFEMSLFRERNIEVIPVDTLNITKDTAAILTEMSA